jgi:hypothetical protein
VALWCEYTGSEMYIVPRDFEFGIAPLPVGRGTMTNWVAFGYYISRDTPHSRQCWEWIKFLSEHNIEIVEQLPARRSIAESSAFRAKVGEEEAEIYLFSMEQNERQSQFHETFWLGKSRYWLVHALGRVMEGNDLEESLAEAQRKADAYIACLESKAGFADEKVQTACAKEVDHDYWEFGKEE